MLHVKISKPPARRRVCFDLENRPWAYWYDGQTTSQVTTIGWKWSDESEVRTLLLLGNGRFLTDFGKRVSKLSAYGMFCSELAGAVTVFGHNIRRHDLPMLNAQLWRLRAPMLPPLYTTDTCRDLPKSAGMSKSLANLAKRYGLEGEKKSMTEPDWESANELTTAGIELARERVISDVLLQEQLRDVLEADGVLRDPRWWRP